MDTLTSLQQTHSAVMIEKQDCLLMISELKKEISRLNQIEAAYRSSILSREALEEEASLLKFANEKCEKKLEFFFQIHL